MTKDRVAVATLFGDDAIIISESGTIYRVYWDAKNNCFYLQKVSIWPK